jgi:hypothetical protein
MAEGALHASGSAFDVRIFSARYFGVYDSGPAKRGSAACVRGRRALPAELVGRRIRRAARGAAGGEWGRTLATEVHASRVLGAAPGTLHFGCGKARPSSGRRQRPTAAHWRWPGSRRRGFVRLGSGHTLRASVPVHLQVLSSSNPVGDSNPCTSPESHGRTRSTQCVVEAV